MKGGIIKIMIMAVVAMLPPALMSWTRHQSPLRFQVSAIEQHPDDGLVRVKGELLGEPHTSNRIDSITLTAPGIRVTATDIDGVDFRRYFQWEDEGEIDLEIDFPRTTVPAEATMIFHTVMGDVNVPCRR